MYQNVTYSLSQVAEQMQILVQDMTDRFKIAWEHSLQMHYIIMQNVMLAELWLISVFISLHILRSYPFLNISYPQIIPNTSACLHFSFSCTPEI